MARPNHQEGKCRRRICSKWDGHPPSADLAMVSSQRTVRRFATSAGAALLMATVLPVAATLSPAGPR